MKCGGFHRQQGQVAGAHAFELPPCRLRLGFADLPAALFFAQGAGELGDAPCGGNEFIGARGGTAGNIGTLGFRRVRRRQYAGVDVQDQ